MVVSRRLSSFHRVLFPVNGMMDATGRMQPQQEAPTCAFLHNNCEFSLINYDTAPVIVQPSFQLSRTRDLSVGKMGNVVGRETGYKVDSGGFLVRVSRKWRSERGNFLKLFRRRWNCGLSTLKFVAADRRSANSAKNGFKYGFIFSSKQKYFLREINPTFHSRIQEISRNGFTSRVHERNDPAKERIKKYIRNFAPRVGELCLHFCSRAKQVRTWSEVRHRRGRSGEWWLNSVRGKKNWSRDINSSSIMYNIMILSTACNFSFIAYNRSSDSRVRYMGIHLIGFTGTPFI